MIQNQIWSKGLFHCQWQWHTIQTCPENTKNIGKFRHLQWSVQLTWSHCHRRQCRWHGRILSETSQSIKHQNWNRAPNWIPIIIWWRAPGHNYSEACLAWKSPIACETQLVCNWEGGGSTIDKNDPDLGDNGDPDTTDLKTILNHPGWPRSTQKPG